MLKAKIRIRLKCPRHRYNPETDGEASIRGGCVFCTRLYVMFQTVRMLERAERTFREEIEQFGKPSPAPKRPRQIVGVL